VTHQNHAYLIEICVILVIGGTKLIKLYITLDGNEFEALLKSAIMDLREPKEEARFLLRLELERRGLIESESDFPNQDIINNKKYG
jgi:hypothetical protein